MTTTASENLHQGSLPPIGGTGAKIAAIVDRWIYVIMAGWFIVTVLAGFIPSSIGKVMAVRLGFREPFPLVLHLHAVLMGSWLLLLLAQTILMAKNKRTYHMQLGIAGAVLMPAMVLTGFVLVPTMYLQAWSSIRAAPPEFLPGGSIEVAQSFVSNVVAEQIMTGVLFPLFVGWALMVRRKNAGMHKRLMILATSIPLPAAIDRITWLPTTYPESAISPMLYGILWVMPMFLWDLYRLRSVHSAYIAWFAIYAPAAVAVNLVWGTTDWVTLVQRVMGVT